MRLKILHRSVYGIYILALLVTCRFILHKENIEFGFRTTPPYILITKNVLGLQISVMNLNKNMMNIASSSALPNFYEFKPNWTEKYYAPWMKYDPFISTNNDGLNDTYNYDPQKPDSTLRVIALGDSFTLGAFAKTEESYPKELENMLNAKVTCLGINKFEVLNLGVGGYDIEYAVEHYVRKGAKYIPNVIVWFLKDDDFEEMAELSRSRTNAYTATMPEEVKTDISKWEHFQDIPDNLKDKKDQLWGQLYYASNKELLTEYGQGGFSELQTESIKKLREITTARIILATFSFTNDLYKTRMKQWVTTEPNMQFFDGIKDVYKLGLNNLPYDAHPTAEGYKVIAEDIYQYLAHNVLQSCNNIN